MTNFFPDSPCMACLIRERPSSALTHICINFNRAANVIFYFFSTFIHFTRVTYCVLSSLAPYNSIIAILLRLAQSIST